jgi:hypothetical protein
VERAILSVKTEPRNFSAPWRLQMDGDKVAPGRDAPYREVSLHPVPGKFRFNTHAVNE